METKALVPVQDMSLPDTLTLGKTLADSGFFSDVRQAQQAVVKILAGREMGFGPIASMTGIHIIKNKVVVGANLMAASVKADPRYNYRVVEMGTERCELAFFEGGKEIGRSIYTIEEARTAGVGGATPPGKPGTMLEMYPRNMLFARAMSNGVKWFCPDAFGGATVYTPDELDVPTDADGEVITVTATPAPDNGNGNGPHWIENDTVRKRFWAWATGDGENSLALTNEQVHEALGVEHVADYDGSMQDAKAAILAWVDNQANIEQAELVEVAE